MKQTAAVEWFWNQLPETLPFTVDTETAVKLQEAYQQAKAMEKEQHQQTAAHFFPTSLKKEDFEQYYTETYEK